MTFQIKRLLLVAVLGAFGIAVGVAATPAKAQDVPLATPKGFEPFANLTLGGFAFYNRIQGGVQATNNIRQDPTEETDLKTILAINSVARSTWERHALAFTASYVDQQAVDTEDQESNALSGSVSGRYDIGSQWNISGGVLHTESIVGKNDPEQFSGNLNGTTVEDTVEAALDWTGDKYFARLETRYQEIANETDIDVTILSRIQQQDREEMNATLQFGQKYSWGQAYVLGGPLRIKYSGSDVILPEDRDSEGVRGGFGVEYQQGDIRAIFRMIGFAQYYDASTIGQAIDVVGTAQLTYQMTDTLAVAGKLERNFDETNIATSAGLFTNLASVGALYQVRDDIYVKLGPTYRFYEIEGTDLEAESFTFDGQAAWQVHDRVELVLNASVSNQIVNDAFLANLQYDEAAVTLSTVVTF